MEQQRGSQANGRAPAEKAVERLREVQSYGVEEAGEI